MYLCISEHSERTSQWLCTHVSQSIHNLQVSSYVLIHIRAFRTYKSVLCTHVSQSSQNLQVSSYVLVYLRSVRTYKSVVMYSFISEHSELTSQWLCTHASLTSSTELPNGPVHTKLREPIFCHRKTCAGRR